MGDRGRNTLSCCFETTAHLVPRGLRPCLVATRPQIFRRLVSRLREDTESRLHGAQALPVAFRLQRFLPSFRSHAGCALVFERASTVASERVHAEHMSPKTGVVRSSKFDISLPRSAAYQTLRRCHQPSSRWARYYEWQRHFGFMGPCKVGHFGHTTYCTAP